MELGQIQQFYHDLSEQVRAGQPLLPLIQRIPAAYLPYLNYIFKQTDILCHLVSIHHPLLDFRYIDKSALYNFIQRESKLLIWQLLTQTVAIRRNTYVFETLCRRQYYDLAKLCWQEGARPGVVSAAQQYQKMCFTTWSATRWAQELVRDIREMVWPYLYEIQPDYAEIKGHSSLAQVVPVQV